MSLDTPSSVSHRSRPVFRWAQIGIGLLLVCGAAAWYGGLLPGLPSKPPANAIMVIAPYRYQGAWVFDDRTVGLVKEPFVAGVPEMIDVLVKDIPNADGGFRLLFSAQAFPGHQKVLKWLRGDGGGNYYSFDDPPMEGWICPAMFKYYEKAPANLYVRAEAIASR